MKIGLLIVFLLVLNSLSVFSSPSLYAQSCTLPAQVQNVVITYPNCEAGTCNFTQGRCSWAQVTGATGYSVVITAVSTSTQVLNQQVGAVTSQVFTVATSDTYKCDVSAINSCGTGTAGTSTLYCKVDFVPTLTPTPTPTQGTVIIPTTGVTTAPAPNIAPPGSNSVIWTALAGFVMIAIGFSAILLL